MNQTTDIDSREILLAGSELIQLEATLLDDRSWDEWLALYVENCIFWIPAWRSDGTLVDNPKREVSHIYTAGRGGLEDRVVRIRSKYAVSSVPLQRTTHLLSPSRLIAAPERNKLRLRTTWSSHVFSLRTRSTDVFFGHYEHDLVRGDDAWRIAYKKIVLKGDYIPTMMDFYFV